MLHPQRLHWIGPDGLHLTPFVHGLKGIRHPGTLRKESMRKIAMANLSHTFLRHVAHPVDLWGVFTADRHFMQAVDKENALLLHAHWPAVGRDPD